MDQRIGDKNLSSCARTRIVEFGIGPYTLYQRSGYSSIQMKPIVFARVHNNYSYKPACKTIKSVHCFIFFLLQCSTLNFAILFHGFTSHCQSFCLFSCVDFIIAAKTLM